MCWKAHWENKKVQALVRENSYAYKLDLVFHDFMIALSDKIKCMLIFFILASLNSDGFGVLLGWDKPTITMSQKNCNKSARRIRLASHFPTMISNWSINPRWKGKKDKNIRNNLWKKSQGNQTSRHKAAIEVLVIEPIDFKDKGWKSKQILKKNWSGRLGLS